MKKVKYILISVLAASMVSCNGWLTVRPAMYIEVDRLVQTEDGLRQALSGIYIQMRNMTYHPSRDMGGAGIPERMAGSYNTGAFSQELANLFYTTAMESDNETMFIRFYNTLANVNVLLNAMEEYEDLHIPEVYNIVRGEALAIRALLHLDLLRIYGPTPSDYDPMTRYLPYATTHDHMPYTYNTFEEYRDFLLADLDEAESLLVDYDPVITEPFSVTEVMDFRWEFRKSRLNYYGVLGLQARAHLWFGDDEEALRYARLVKDAEEPDGSPKFRLTTAADMTDGAPYSNDRLYFSEHLCGVRIESYDIYNSAISGYDPWVVSQLPYKNTDMLRYVSVGHATPLTSISGTTDIRVSKCMYEGWGGRPMRPNVWTCGKFMGFTTTSNSPKNYPIMRLAEVYFIIMELGTPAEATELFQEYATARSMDYTYPEITDANRGDMLFTEFSKEFYGEAQNFFFYKRRGVAGRMFNNAVSVTDPNLYRLPVPQRESSNIH